MKTYFLESCVITLHDAVAAEINGADRLEICTRLETEGMTPDIGLVKSILEKTQIPLRVMIRETEIGFEAEEETIQKMIASIDEFKHLPIDGFVFAILKNNKTDRTVMLELFKHAHPLPVTFHKAIDLSNTKWDDIKWLNDQSSVDTILTSGNPGRAVDNLDEIQKMKFAFNKNIMACGKITHDQLPAIHQKLNLKWYHGRNILPLQKIS